MIQCRAAGVGLLLHVCLISCFATRDPHAALPPLTSEAVEALRNPYGDMDPSVARELEGIWAERSAAFIRSVMGESSHEFESQLWTDQLAGKPYLHFKASGKNRGYASDPRRNVVVVLFIGPTEEEINAEFGSWFAPFQDGSQFIETIDIGAERAAHTNITDDGTHSIYWQQDNAFIEVRSRDDVLGLAREAHAQAKRTGIYSFPQSYLLTSFANGAGAVSSTLGGKPDPSPVSTPAATPTPRPQPAMQPTQEELADGWERIGEDAEIMQPAGTPEPPPARAEASVPEGPRIPTATLGLALHAAVRRDEPSPVTALIRAGAGVETRDSEGRTPLMTAVEAASPELVRLLIQQGARLEAIPVGSGVRPEDLGMTPLMMAARAGRVGIIEVLIDAGASIAAVNGRGMSALEIAVEYGHEEAVRTLQRAAGNEPPEGETAGASETTVAAESLTLEAEEGASSGSTPLGGEGVISASDSPEIDAAQAPAGETSPDGEADSGKMTDISTERPGIMDEEPGALKTSQGATLVTSVGEVRLWQARLEAAWKRLDVDLNENIDASVLRAVILNWDARVNPESTGVMGYEYWRAALADLSPDDPVTAPEPSTDLSDERVVQALRNAAANLRRDFDAIEVPYSRKVY